MEVADLTDYFLSDLFREHRKKWLAALIPAYTVVGWGKDYFLSSVSSSKTHKTRVP